MQIRFSTAWGRFALAMAMIVFLVGLATLDGNSEEHSVTGILQVETI